MRCEQEARKKFWSLASHDREKPQMRTFFHGFARVGRRMLCVQQSPAICFPRLARMGVQSSLDRIPRNGTALSTRQLPGGNVKLKLGFEVSAMNFQGPQSLNFPLP
jgi:hypothetical protein